MKLRIRINRQTSRLELDGAEPTLSELRVRISDTLLRSDVAFSLSLNGTEELLDTGQTLSSCGVVSGDMISVILPQGSSQHTHTHTAPDTPSGAGNTPSSSEEASGADSSSARDSGMEECVSECVSAAPPLLCCEMEEDGLIPHTLERLLDSSSCQNPSDCLTLAVHLLLMETGFLPQGSNVNSGEMPIGWRAAGGVYRLQYAHPLLENSLVSVVAVPMGETLVINAVLKTDSTTENSRKLALKPEAYVTADWAGGSAGVVYRDLRKLSRLFKDQLVYPLMAAARQALGLPALFGLAVLPPELLLRVLRLLDVVSLVSLSAVCRDLNNATHDPSVWRHLLHRDFRGRIPAVVFQNRDTDWREIYKQKYRQRNVRRCGVYPHHNPAIFPSFPFPFPSAPSPLPPPLFPPGIIGGDYDQAPVLLPRPRFDPIGPIPGHLPASGIPIGRRGNRSADIRRGFI
ncbi:F-box only protein 7 [Pseudorasbora parva]|uniref:F-box only protein 7 n=1 Tax=Pseudorasbora parva TaxID=51549 RepID=UPI00351E533A